VGDLLGESVEEIRNNTGGYFQCSSHPRVARTDWCGEHQPRNPVKPPNASAGLPELVDRNSLSVRTRKIVLHRLGLPLETQGIDAAAVRAISYTEWREQSRCSPLVLQELQKVFGVGQPTGEHQPRETEGETA
jgi:hypothetical protein